MQASDFILLCKFALLSGSTLINEKTYKEINSLAQGNDLSPLMAIIYMHDLE